MSGTAERKTIQCPVRRRRWFLTPFHCVRRGSLFVVFSHFGEPACAARVRSTTTARRHKGGLTLGVPLLGSRREIRRNCQATRIADEQAVPSPRVETRHCLSVSGMLGASRSTDRQTVAHTCARRGRESFRRRTLLTAHAPTGRTPVPCELSSDLKGRFNQPRASVAGNRRSVALGNGAIAIAVLKGPFIRVDPGARAARRIQQTGA